MPTLLFLPRHNNDLRVLGHAARHAGWEVVQSPSWRLPVTWIMCPPIAIYGETLFAELAASALDLALLEPPDDWLPGLPDSFRKREISLTKLDRAKTESVPQFIKPANDKSFPAAVYSDSAVLQSVSDGLPDDFPVLMSEPVVWETEYRIFAIDAKPLTISQYFQEGRLVDMPLFFQPSSPTDDDLEALDFATEVLETTRGTLPSGVVLDVGTISGRGFAVVEANPAWASGL